MDRETHNSLQGDIISGSPDVAHRLDDGPQTSNTAQTRQGRCHLNVSSRETELVPATHHAAFTTQLAGVLPRECDLEGTGLGGDGGGVVPLEVTRVPVVEVDSFPKGIVAGVESSPVVVEFARED